MDSINKSVIDKLAQRAAVGEKKYGTTMDREDLDFRQWLVHFQEELMDAAVYVEKLISLEDKKNNAQ